MRQKVLVMGCGLVGSAIVKDLAPEYRVTAADISGENLGMINSIAGVEVVTADLSDAATVNKLAADHDLVIGALPGFMGYNSVKHVIAAGKNMVDISFFPEDPFGLDRLAKSKGVTVVTDCGVAPGMGNIILGYHHPRMNVQKFTCMVGGLPFKREWPWQYKAVFSPADVIEEYTRPARYIINGEMVIREALSEPEYVEFEKVGTLEAWNSDGLRSLIQTMPVPNMIEKTLRYPGTIDYLRMLRETGFFSNDEIEVKGVRIKPIDLTSQLVFPKWKLKEGEEDFTVMRIVVEGINAGVKERYTYNLFDRFDRDNGITSMARTTGYTCTAVANLMLEGRFSRPGINPAEYTGTEDGNLTFILEYLKERNVIYSMEKIS
ncbi:MAG: saccharopine dehydrogenase NADP-binding domain-containing protein [Bacteroidales bacterium]|nr:saccharopine dehydrogenase NADP-binding domain-containing protein [Bacteroidales bacterium]